MNLWCGSGDLATVAIECFGGIASTPFAKSVPLYFHPLYSHATSLPHKLRHYAAGCGLLVIGDVVATMKTPTMWGVLCSPGFALLEHRCYRDEKAIWWADLLATVATAEDKTAHQVLVTSKQVCPLSIAVVMMLEASPHCRQSWTAQHANMNTTGSI